MAISRLATPYQFENFGAIRWNSRGGTKITTIVIHHMATTNYNSVPGIWANREASAHYGIGPNGEIRAYVDEEKRAWHCGDGNSYSIGIENCNVSMGPDWKVSDKTVDSLVELIKEIQSRRGKLKIEAHCDVPGNATACCGPCLYPRLQEIRDRVNASVPTPKPPVTSKPNTTSGAFLPVKFDGNKSKAHLNEFGQNTATTLYTRGWHVGNYKYQYLFIMDYNTNKEIARKLAKGVSRPDVNKAYNTTGNVGFSENWNLAQFRGRKIYVMARCTNDPTGNTVGGFSDISFKDWFHEIPK